MPCAARPEHSAQESRPWRILRPLTPLPSAATLPAMGGSSTAPATASPLTAPATTESTAPATAFHRMTEARARARRVSGVASCEPRPCHRRAARPKRSRIWPDQHSAQESRPWRILRPLACPKFCVSMLYLLVEHGNVIFEAECYRSVILIEFPERCCNTYQSHFDPGRDITLYIYIDPKWQKNSTAVSLSHNLID